VVAFREAYVSWAEMTEPTPIPPTPAEQKEIVKSGCMTVVAWIVMLAAFAAVFFGAEWMMAKIMAPPPGPDVIDFGCAKCIAKELIIVSTERVVTTQVRGEGGADFRYAVEIKTKTGSYISMDVGGESPVQSARQRIRSPKR
jgi:hypothetical protein